MKLTVRLQIVGACLAVLGGCASAQKAIDQKMKSVDGVRWFSGAYEVSCDRAGVQGEQILTVFSVGRNDEGALRETRRNAVRALVFRGVRTSQCSVDPIITPEAFDEKADKYFDAFFKEGGQYLSYVEYAGDEIETRVKVGKQVKIGTTVIVQRGRLLKDLESAGVVQSMGGIFGKPRAG